MPIIRAIAYALVGAVCSTLVGALSYGVGNLIAMRLGEKAVTMTHTIVAASQRIGWGWTGAAVGMLVGLNVGILRLRPIRLSFLGAILGAFGFIAARTMSSAMDALINWAALAGIVGFVACGISGVAHAVKRHRYDSVGRAKADRPA